MKILNTILIVLLLLATAGCANRPTYSLHTLQPPEPPTTLDLLCGHIYSITDATGLTIFSADDPRYDRAYPGTLKLKPGTYTLDYGWNFRNNRKVRAKNTVTLHPGHVYKFAQYRGHYGKRSKWAWLWIEDWTTAEVIAGATPPSDIKKEWQGLWDYYCPSITLDYLK